MRPLFTFAALLAVAGAAAAQMTDGRPRTEPHSGSAHSQEETLNYTINWPSGLSLGEGRIEAGRKGERWEFQLSIDAAVPGFSFKNRFRSVVADGFCALEFEKDFVHGRRKGRERTTFDPQKAAAIRETLDGGGKTELQVPACSRDPLGFLFHLRDELRNGRLPPAQTIYFGAPYQVRVEYGGTQQVRLGEERVEADRLTVSFKGPASESSFEMFFARDASRTPVLVRAPFAMGLFSMELVR
jgi:hypothetical protein